MDVTMQPDRQHSLDLLLARRSVSALQEPAPTDKELALILDTALRACDGTDPALAMAPGSPL